METLKGATVNVMDGRAISRMSLGFCIAIISWLLLDSFYSIHVLLAYQKY